MLEYLTFLKIIIIIIWSIFF